MRNWDKRNKTGVPEKEVDRTNLLSGKDACQDCKYHSNNPSKCSINDTFVGRKADVCHEFRRK